MKGDGSTRRLSFSPSFFWILGFLLVVILVSLTYLTHQFVNLTLERDSLQSSLDNVVRFNEKKEYNQAVAMAPEEARRILEILDRAIVMSESDDGEIGLIGVPEPIDETTNAQTETTEALAPSLSEDAPTDESSQADAGQDNFNTAADPLQEAWQSWHKTSGPVKTQTNLDIDDFEVSSSGQVTFLLRQNGEPGLRVKGRVIVVLAISDEKGTISLVSAPEMDLTKPEQGWELGSKYNIIASKLVRAQAPIPNGAKILNAEVASWDEETKELVFRKKILIEDK
jgi:hypothetical protein